MEFDEIDYLEKTFDVSQEQPKPKETANGGDDKIDPRGNGGSQTSKLKGDEKVDGDDEYHRTKHSRSEHNSHDNDRRGERDSSRHHSRPRDTERDRHRSHRESRDKERGRDRDRNREERNGRDRDRDKERDHDRGHDRERAERDSDRDSERERIKQGEEERLYRSKSQSERHRSRSQSQSDRHQSDRGEKDIGRSWEGEQRGRLKDELRDRESRRQKDKKEEVAETEVDPERDQRTVFAYQINLKADERDVYDFFSRAGKVRDVRLIMDRNSRRSKGVGYVEFYDAMSVPMAIALSGQLLLGQAVMVKPSEAEKNLVQSTAASNAAFGGPMGPYSGGARRLYVGNLHANITEDQLRQVFEPFGTVELVQLPLNESGQCKGYGFVQFARLEDARNALNLNGQIEIADRPIKVSAVTDQIGSQDAGTNPADIDDDEGGGLSLNAHARALLMQKLDRTGTASSMVSSLASPAVSTGVILPTVPTLGGVPVISPVVAPLLQGSFPTLQGGIGMASHLQAAVSSVDTVGVQSECLLLKNMFDPKDEVEVDFDLDIKEDVREECSKFGEVKHIFVDKNSAGFVYLRFGNVQSAIDAQKALHGRWFAGKMITATFMVPQAYEYKFPDSGL